MSRENVEIVRRSYEAGNRGDLDAAFADYHPEVEAIDDPRVPGAKTMRGIAEVRRFFESMARYWESVRTEPERFVDLGDDVLVLGRMTARTRRGGPEIERALDSMVTLREGKIIRIRLFSSRAEALEAAGLSQENVELVRRMYEALTRNDSAAAWSLAHPDAEVTFQRGPGAGTHRGREQIQAVFDDARAAFESWVIEPSEIFENGDRVVVIVKNRLRPVGTEGEIEFRNGHIWTIRDGLVVSLVGFPSPEEALEAAGLRE